MANYTLTPTQSDQLDISPGEDDSREGGESDDICGAEMTDGSTCQRDPDECPYEAHRDD